MVSSASVAVWTECFFCGRVSGVISGRAGCPCSRPFFLGPCAVSLDTANEKMAAGQPGPLTLLWPVFRAPRLASRTEQVCRLALQHCTNSLKTLFILVFNRLQSVVFTRSFYNIIFHLKQLVYFHLTSFCFYNLVFYCLNTKAGAAFCFLLGLKQFLHLLKRSEPGICKRHDF